MAALTPRNCAETSIATPLERHKAPETFTMACRRLMHVCALGWSLAACDRPDAPVVIELWAAGREGEVVPELVRDFEVKHPGVRVKVQTLPWSSAHEKLLTAVVGGSAPDVAQLGNTWIPEFATIGALAPLDSYRGGSRVVDEADYFAGVWATNRFEGQLFGVPWYVDTRLLFYRRDLLAQAGFSQPPSTWSEWRGMLKVLQQGAKPGQAALMLPLNEPEPLIALALQQPEPLLRGGGRYGNFSSAGFGRALSFYVELFREGLAPTAGTAQIANLWDEFGRGNFTFFVSGPWQLGELRRRLPRALDGRWGTARMPGADGPGASLAGGASLVVFESSERKKLAWQLIEYLAEPGVQRRFYGLTGDLPARRSSWEGAPLATDREAQAFRQQLEQVEPVPPVPEWERIASEIARVAERAARGLVSVEAAQSELDQKTDRILEKRRWVLARSGEVQP